MIPEIELRDIQPKGSSDVPSSSHIQTGLPIPKQCGFSSLALTNGSRLQRNGQVISKMNMLQPDALGVLVILG